MIFSSWLFIWNSVHWSRNLALCVCVCLIRESYCSGNVSVACFVLNRARRPQKQEGLQTAVWLKKRCSGSSTGRDEGSRGAEESHRADGSPAVPRPAAGGGKLRALQGETWRFHPDACCKSFCSLALMQEMSLYLDRSAGKGYWIPCHIQWGPDVWEHFCLAFLCFHEYAFHFK